MFTEQLMRNEPLDQYDPKIERKYRDHFRDLYQVGDTLLYALITMSETSEELIVIRHTNIKRLTQEYDFSHMKESTPVFNRKEIKE